MSDETLEAKNIKKLEQARLRQAKHYALQKEKVNAKRREKYKECVAKCFAEVDTDVNNPFIPDKPLFTVDNKKIVDLSKHKTLSYDEIVKYLDDLELKPLTLEKYKQDLKRFSLITDCKDNMILCFKRHVKIITDIQKYDKKAYSNNTIKGLYQMILFIIDRFNLKINKKPYLKVFEIAKLQSIEDNDKKADTVPIMKFSEYLKKIKTEFGEKSKMFVLTKLYDELTLRDDFQLFIVDKIGDTKDDTRNYIVLYPSKPFKIIINNYKTQTQYGVIKENLSKELTKLIKTFIKENNIQIGDYLFGKENLSSFVSKNNKLVGLTGSISEFRHMKISEELAKVPSLEERKDLADKMRHSPITQLKYIRKIFTDTD
jgi:hypothetical protein